MKEENFGCSEAIESSDNQRALRNLKCSISGGSMSNSNVCLRRTRMVDVVTPVFSRTAKWIAASLMLGSAVTASAATQVSGRILTYHLNPGVSGRGACITMAPALPESNNACLFKSHALYAETNTILLTAYAAGKQCTVWLDQKDSGGNWILSIITCAD